MPVLGNQIRTHHVQQGFKSSCWHIATSQTSQNDLASHWLARFRIPPTCCTRSYAQQGAAYYENAAFVCLVFDVSSRDSFESCGRWLQGVRAALPAASAPLPGVLIANKADLREGGINARAVVNTKVHIESSLFAAAFPTPPY